MKSYLIISSVAIVLSSCLKQSIPDAMLGVSKQKKIKATLSYEVNGTSVAVTVDDADHQPDYSRRLYCQKTSAYYVEAITDYGEFTFYLFTDSLKVGSYSYPSLSGGLFIADYPGPNFVYYATDYMNINVTSYENGHISGNFSGLLTPKPNDIWGVASSTSVTNGSFSNVPVIY
jgi:hypothetical protein